jgi:hypothetical protein
MVESQHNRWNIKQSSNEQTVEETAAEMNAVIKYWTRPVYRISTDRLREKNKKP